MNNLWQWQVVAVRKPPSLSQERMLCVQRVCPHRQWSDQVKSKFPDNKALRKVISLYSLLRRKCALPKGMHKMWRIIKPNKEGNSQGWGEVSNAEIPAADPEKGIRVAQAPGITEVLQGHVRHRTLLCLYKSPETTVMPFRESGGQLVVGVLKSKEGNRTITKPDKRNGIEENEGQAHPTAQPWMRCIWCF